MLNRPLSIAALGLLMLALALPAQAQWKWRDNAGKIQYSDLPPPNGTPEKDILQRPAGLKQFVVIQPVGAAAAASAPALVASGPSKAELDQQAKQKQQDQDALAKQKEEERKLALQRRDNCTRAQGNLKLLQDGVRLTRANDKGESVPLDERQRAEEMQRTRSLMSSECR
jgi:hypothetical protein